MAESCGAHTMLAQFGQRRDGAVPSDDYAAQARLGCEDVAQE